MPIADGRDKRLLRRTESDADVKMRLSQLGLFLPPRTSLKIRYPKNASCNGDV